MSTDAPVPDRFGLETSLSRDRLSTYQHATSSFEEAWALYAWNLRASSALLPTLAVFEVTLRNTISAAIAGVHGPEWPWSPGFQRALPQPQKGFCPRSELLGRAAKHSTVGRVVADLKFVFWEKMLNARHHRNIWEQQMPRLFPHSTSSSADLQRQKVMAVVARVRTLRNRVAHHEPIFRRDLMADVSGMMELLRGQNTDLADWLDAAASAQRVLQQQPKVKS